MSAIVSLTTDIAQDATGEHRPRVMLYANYVTAFERLGLTSLLVTPAHSPASVERLVERSQGLVLTGGDDIDPARYGEDPIPELSPVHPGRDAIEFLALDVALRNELPVLAICRGLQLMNVYFGGTLYQDLGTQRPGELRHEQRQPWGARSHRVTIEGGSLLARILSCRDLAINSFHHQAIKDLAPVLNAVAWAEDGLVEAVELRDRAWVLGVQWHPERHEATAPDTDPDRRLLAAFAAAAAERVG